MSDISLKQMRHMFIGKHVRITCSMKGMKPIKGVCKDVKLVHSGHENHFDMRLKKGVNCFFVPEVVGEGFVDGKYTPWDNNTCKIEVVDAVAKNCKHKHHQSEPLFVESFTAEFAGTLNIGDIVQCPAHPGKVATKIERIILPADGDLSDAIKIGTYTYRWAQCILEDGRIIHPSCLRVVPGRK